MRILLLTFIFIGKISFANSFTIGDDSTSVYQEKILAPGEKALWIPVNFNEHDLLKNIPDSLMDLAIVRIDLVYTFYRTSPDFNQNELNQNRISELKSFWPATESDLISWSAVGQSAALDRESAKKLFHGFVIYFRPVPTKESIETEISFLDEYLGMTDLVLNEEKVELKEVTIEETKVIPPSTIKKSSHFGVSDKEESILLNMPLDLSCYDIHTAVRITTKDGIQELIDSVSAIPDYIGSSYGITGDWEGLRKKEITFIWMTQSDSCDTSLPRKTVHTTSFVVTSSTWIQTADYGVVEAVFTRYPQWVNSLIVMDVTGSMSPYIAKTMAWVKASQKSNQVQAFVFFNDGNMTPDRQKKTGQVGGIYSAANTGFEVVYNQMKMTMQKGGGGDCPENNVEATLKGIELYPDAEEIVMVADNWATPRDLELVKLLDRPVHVIICGSGAGVNIAYIQLAYDTGGSVHTIEDDMEMRGIEAGKSFKLGQCYYTLIGGKIVKAENK